jgi:hypothetical protein
MIGARPISPSVFFGFLDDWHRSILAAQFSVRASLAFVSENSGCCCSVEGKFRKLARALNDTLAR